MLVLDFDVSQSSTLATPESIAAASAIEEADETAAMLAAASGGVGLDHQDAAAAADAVAAGIAEFANGIAYFGDDGIV